MQRGPPQQPHAERDPQGCTWPPTHLLPIIRILGHLLAAILRSHWNYFLKQEALFLSLEEALFVP